MSNKLAVYAPDEAEWGKIVDRIVDQLEQDDLPEEVIQATEYLLAGYPIHDIAKKLDKKPYVIRQWISKYPQIAAILQEQRAALIRWRLAQMDQQFLQAVKKSSEILSLDLQDDKINTKLISALGQHVRYILSLSVGQKIDINVTHNVGDATLRATQDALNYLAQQLGKQREDNEPIEATFRVIDPRYPPQPLLSETGDPPHGTLGTLDYSQEEGYLCHLCGKRVKHLVPHLETHNIEPDEYEYVYMLPRGSVKSARPK